MAWIDNSLANVYHDHVEPADGHVVGDAAPDFLLATQLHIGLELGLDFCGLLQFVRKPLAPHVVSEMKQKRLYLASSAPGPGRLV